MEQQQQQQQTETTSLTNSVEGSPPPPTTPKPPEQIVNQPAQQMADAIEQQRPNNNPDQVLTQIAAKPQEQTQPSPRQTLSQTQIEEGKRLIAARDKGEHPISYLGLNPQQQDQLVEAVRDYQAQAEPLRVDKTLSPEEQAKQEEAAAAAHGVATRINQAAGQDPDAILQAVADSSPAQQDHTASTQTRRPETTEGELGEIRMVQGPDGTFIPEQQAYASRRTEVGRIMVGNTEVPVYSDTELLSLSRASEIVYQATGHAANLQELQAIIGGMEALNKESFPDDDTYNQGLAVVMRELEYLNSDIPVVVVNGATVDGKPMNTEVISGTPETERPAKEELERAWQLMASTSRGRVMEMLAYLQDYQAVTLGKFEPYQEAMPESRKAAIGSKVSLGNVIEKTQTNRVVYEKQRDEDLKIITEELSSLSPSEIQQRIEEFTTLGPFTEENERAQAKAIAEAVGKMVELGRSHELKELLEIASFYYEGFRIGKYLNENRFPALPSIARFNLEEFQKVNVRTAIAAAIPSKLEGNKLHIAFEVGHNFVELPVESRIEIMAHEYQHMVDYNSGLMPTQTQQELEKLAVTEMNAFTYQYKIYELLKRYFPTLTSPIADFIGERLKEGQASILSSMLAYAQLIMKKFNAPAPTLAKATP